MRGIGVVASGIEAELRRRLPRRRKTRRGEPALSVATTLGERSADLTDPAAALPRPTERVDVRCQRVARLLADPRVDCDALMRPFAGEATRRTRAGPGPGQDLGPAPGRGRACGWASGPRPWRGGCGRPRGGI